MKALFILSNSETAFWLSELTHPYWHLTKRGVEVDFSSPHGGKVVWDPYSDPYFKNSTEPGDLVSKGFLSDQTLVAKLDATLRLRDVNLDIYDAVTWPAVAARPSTFTERRRCARAGAFLGARQSRRRDLSRRNCAGQVPGSDSGPPGDRIYRSLETASCNVFRERVPDSALSADRPRGGWRGVFARRAQRPLRHRRCKLVTGQNQQSASEYALALLHEMDGRSPVLAA